MRVVPEGAWDDHLLDLVERCGHAIDGLHALECSRAPVDLHSEHNSERSTERRSESMVRLDSRNRVVGRTMGMKVRGGGTLCGSIPRMVRISMSAGERWWKGPRRGLVLMRFCFFIRR